MQPHPPYQYQKHYNRENLQPKSLHRVTFPCQYVSNIFPPWINFHGIRNDLNALYDRWNTCQCILCKKSVSVFGLVERNHIDMGQLKYIWLMIRLLIPYQSTFLKIIFHMFTNDKQTYLIQKSIKFMVARSKIRLCVIIFQFIPQITEIQGPVLLNLLYTIAILPIDLKLNANYHTPPEWWNNM